MITTDNISDAIRIDAEWDLHKRMGESHNTIHCIYPCIDIHLVDTPELNEIADLYRMQRGFLPMYYETEEGAYDSEGWYDFTISITGPREGFWKNHVAALEVDVCESCSGDDGQSYVLDLPLELTEEIYDYLSEVTKENYGKTLDELLKEAEREEEYV